MPQMSPMMWDILFMFFILSFMLMNSLMYWFKSFKSSYKKNNIKMKNINWKW
uniref:ATPase subunit 8 n=1 Tax=Ninus insignis TaxID=2813438 RepID=UPI002008EED2|nr:ATPase subunit 8 [Ninus insignis]UPI55264.1 ATPase subunit 8 [Ninus insignis]